MVNPGSPEAESSSEDEPILMSQLTCPYESELQSHADLPDHQVGLCTPHEILGADSELHQNTHGSAIHDTIVLPTVGGEDIVSNIAMESSSTENTEEDTTCIHDTSMDVHDSPDLTDSPINDDQTHDSPVDDSNAAQPNEVPLLASLSAGMEIFVLSSR